MWGYIWCRIRILPLLFIVITFFSFLIMQLAPGDPTTIMLSPKVKPEDRSRIRHNLGLDRPVYIQYFIWLKNLTLKGELGYSMINGQPVFSSILSCLPPTFILMGGAYVLSLLLAILVGVYSAKKRNSLQEQLISLLAITGISVPAFWLGLMSMYVFTIKLNLLPSMGMFTPGLSGGTLVKVKDFLQHLILPLTVLTITTVAYWSRYLRSSLIEVLAEDYILVARAKGLPERRVLFYHALKNSLLSLITLIGLSLPDLIGGAYVLEMVFSWPGMGRLGMEAIFHRDYAVVMGIVLFSSILILLANLLTDISYALLDPRIRYD